MACILAISGRLLCAMQREKVQSRIEAAAVSSNTRSFGWCMTMCCFLQTMITFSIIVNLSCLPVYLPPPPLPFISPPLFWQSGGCDSRERCSAGWLASSWSQHHLPTAPWVWVHNQQEGRKVENRNTHNWMHHSSYQYTDYVCFLCFNFSFDMVTFGAMSVTLMFQRPPFLSQTRTIWTPNNNFLVLDQVTMAREQAETPKCDIRSVLSPYPLVLPYPLPRYTGACAEKGPAVPELQVQWYQSKSNFRDDPLVSMNMGIVNSRSFWSFP